MPSYLTSRQVAKKLPNADLAATLPTSDPGGGKPWLRSGVITVGAGQSGTIGWESLPGFLPLDKLPLHNHDSSYYTKPQVDAAIGGIDLSSRVPYTGATATVDLGSHGLKAGAVTANGNINIQQAGGKLIFENQASINLYRNASHLRTDAVFTASSLNSLNAVVGSAVGSVFGTSSAFDATMSLGVRPNATGRIPLGIRLLASQTADAFQVQNSAGAVLTSIGPTGNIATSGLIDTNLVTAASNRLQWRSDDGGQWAIASGGVAGTTGFRVVRPGVADVLMADTGGVTVYGNMTASGRAVIDTTGLTFPSGSSNNVATAAGKLVLAPFNGQLWLGSVGAAGMRSATEFGLASNASINFTNAASNFYSATIDTKLQRYSESNLTISNAAGNAGFFVRADNGRIIAGYDAGGDYLAAGNSLGTAVPLYIGNINSSIRFGSGGERMRIVAATGNVLIGSTTDDGVNRLQVAGRLSSANQTINSTSTANGLTISQIYNGDGINVVLAASGTAYLFSSTSTQATGFSGTINASETWASATSRAVVKGVVTSAVDVPFISGGTFSATQTKPTAGTYGNLAIGVRGVGAATVAGKGIGVCGEAGSANSIAAVFKGFAGQTGSLTEWWDSANSAVAKMSASGNLSCNSLGLWGGTPPTSKPTLPTNPTNAEIATLLSTYGLCTLV